MSFEEMLPEGFKKAVRSFSDGEFLKRRNMECLPGIRNRHEAYGYLTECQVGLTAAMKAVTAAMTDATKLLPAPDDGAFVDIVQALYSAALDTAIAAVNLAVQTQNVTDQLLSNRTADATPMETMAGESPANSAEYLPGDEADGDE
jgi:hypothetical protein